jgi:hypothetical protein
MGCRNTRSDIKNHKGEMGRRNARINCKNQDGRWLEETKEVT